MPFRALSSGEDAVADVVFVHGLRMLRGSPATDWRQRRVPDSFWPEWLQQEFQNVRVGVLSYDSAASRWFGTAMHLEDRATNVLATLRAHGIGVRPVIFVAHSLGGLVIKEMLLQSQASSNSDDRRVAEQCRGVVFLATPHTGSALATIASGIRGLRGTRAIATLLNNDPHLTHLSRRYSSWVAQEGRPRHLVLTENRPVAGGLLVVTAASADPGIHDARLLSVDADHNSIATPSDRDDFVYEQTTRFLRETLADRAPESITAGTTVTAPDATAASAVASRHARDELTPDILPSMTRTNLIERALEFATPIQILFGEGGLGKSVLTGQLFDALDGLRPVILVACSMLRLSQRTSGADQIDAALGALSGSQAGTLTARVKNLEPRPVVIIDTIDLLLNQSNGDEIAVLLGRLSEVGDVIVTCRAREWHDLLAPFADTLALESAPVPPLDRDQVLEWVDAYLTAKKLAPDKALAFRGSVELALAVKRGLAVLGVPLRLAMACQLYVSAGGLPDNLTATRLYSEYWSSRVSAERDGRRNTAAAVAKEQAALQVANDIWDESVSRFIEDVAPINDTQSTNELVSEGVLGRMGGRLHFFHQTFAEFSVAKYLAVEGSQSDLERLGDGLRSRISGYWGVVGHLLLHELSPQRFEAIQSLIPIDFIEGARVSIIGALALDDVEQASKLLHRIATQQPEEFAAAVDLLEDAVDEHVPPVVGMLTTIVEDVESHLTAVVHALGSLIVRLPPATAVSALAHVLDALIARYRRRDPLIDTEAQRLLRVVLQDDTGGDLGLLTTALARYRLLPVAGRRAICAAVDPADPAARREFLDVALKSPVPPGAVLECVELFRAEWLDQDARTRRGWHSWREALGQRLPDLWDAVQVRVIGFGRDRIEAGEMVSECLRPCLAIPRDKLINSTLFLADDHPDWVIEAVLNSGVDENRVAVAALAQIALQLRATLNPARATELVAMLRTVAHVEPRRAWPAMVKVAAIDSEVLESLLTELSGRDDVHPSNPQWVSIVASSVDAIADALGPHGTKREWDQLKPLLERFDESASERLRAVWGIMSFADVDARARVDEAFDSNRLRDQKAMLSAILSAREQLSAQERADRLPWTINLLRARNDGVVSNLAEHLRHDAATGSWTFAGTTFVAERLRIALDRDEDPQASGALLALLATIVHDGQTEAHPTPNQLHQLLDIYRSSIAAAISVGEQSPRLSTMYNQYSDALRRLVKPILGIDAMEQLVVALLTEVDAGAVAQGAIRILAKNLAALVRAAPDRWPVIERQWASAPEANKQAIAETVLNGLISDRDGTALRLAARGDCPPTVAAYLHRRAV